MFQKTLVGYTSGSAQRIPILFSESHPEGYKEPNMCIRKLILPTSIHKNEFHIMKFYSFAPTMVSAILECNFVEVAIKIVFIIFILISLESFKS